MLLISLAAVHAKSLVAILHLLVALSQYFRAPIRLPDHVSIQVVVVQVRGALNSHGSVVKLTEGFLAKLLLGFLAGQACVCLFGCQGHTCIFPAELYKCFPTLSSGSQHLTLTVKWPDFDIKNI